MIKELQDLYEKKWEKLCYEMQRVLDNVELEIKPTCPLLLTVDEEEIYNESDIKLMIFGQETNNWFDIFHSDIKKIQNYYKSYFLSCDWELDTKRIFWKKIKQVIKALHEKYPEKKISFTWNNIIKIGKYKHQNRPPDYIYNIEKEYFSVVHEELKIFKPDVVIFFSGPDYDDVIKDKLGNVLYTPICDLPIRELALLHISEIPFSFRTYHPSGSKFFGKEYEEKCLKAILDTINLKNWQS